jgi:diadenosine tetraphosphate (Ap4A) HIT family hydrolase
MFFAYFRQPKNRPNPMCVSCTPPQHDASLIFFTQHWKVLLHPNQSSLGSVLIVSLRHVPRVAELTRAEMNGFHQIFRQLEPVLEGTFGASLVNLSCERNWAYRKSNPDPPFLNGEPNPHVHWHVVPRYKQRVRFMGVDWQDPAFGEPFIWRKRNIPPDVRLAIIKAIRRKLTIKYVKRVG